MFSNSKEKYNRLAELVTKYSSQLKQNKLEDMAFISANNVVFRSILLTVLSPLFALAYIANVLPVLIGRILTEKIVKTDEFYGSVYVGAGWLLGIIYYILIAVLVSNFTSLSAWLTVFIIMVAGFWSVLLRDQYIKLGKQLKFRNILKKQVELDAEMRRTRTAILELLA